MPDHRVTRAFERYGLVVDQTAIAEMAAQIVARKSLLLQRNGNGEVHAVKHSDDTLLIAVWAPAHDGHGNRIVTFLPPDFCKPGARRRYATNAAMRKRRRAERAEVRL